MSCPAPEIIDQPDAGAQDPATGTFWQLYTDQVMGGVSAGRLTLEPVAGRPARRMSGAVSLANNGGFIQISLDLAADGGAVDASMWAGVELLVHGNDETYGVHLRTVGLTRPWQSYRQSFLAPARWQTLRLGFAGFAAHRTDQPLDLRQLRRLGIAAIGRAFHADLALGGLRFWR